MPLILSQEAIADSGLPAETSEAVFEQINRFAGYGFNKSHAAAYAAIAFQTAWLKTHHPESFFAAAMNLDLDSVEDIAQFADEMKTRKIPFWTPSINQSRARFTPLLLTKPYHGHSHGIAYALAAIRGVGHGAACAIENERAEHGKFSGFDDFTARMNGAVNRGALRALARAGAFDCLGLSRSEALVKAEDRQASNPSGQMSMFEVLGAEAEMTVPELAIDEVLDNEFNVLGHYMSAHPLEGLDGPAQFRDAVLHAAYAPRSVTMGAIPTKVDVRRTNSGDTMAVITLSDPDGIYEALVFGETWNDLRQIIKKGARLVLDMTVSQRGRERRLLVERARGLAPAATGVAA